MSYCWVDLLIILGKNYIEHKGIVALGKAHWPQLNILNLGKI